MQSKDARYLNVLLGIWLFISAFLWRHSSAQMTNTWLMGVITVIVAWISTTMPQFRFVNTAVGIWLVISAFALPHMRTGTVWNNLLVGIAIAVVSLMGPVTATGHGRRVTTSA